MQDLTPVTKKLLHARSGMSARRNGVRVAYVLVVIYLAVVTAWLYVVAANSDDYGGSPGRAWVVLGAFLLGLAVARWRVTLVPLLLPALAAWAGRGTNPDSDIGIAGEMFLLVMPASVIAAALGVWLSRLVRRRFEQRNG